MSAPASRARKLVGRLPSKPVLVLSGVLIALGGAIFLWKAVWLEMPILPSRSKNVWRVEMELDVRGEGKNGSVSVWLPSSGPRQQIYDERFETDGLTFDERHEGDQRIGVWRGKIEGLRRFTHFFRVRLASGTEDGREFATPGDIEPVELPLGPEDGVPTDAPELGDLLLLLATSESVDAAGRSRQIFSFVAEEIETVPTASEDALLTFAAREGNGTGKARLLAALLRTSEIPARLVTGLRLTAPHGERRLSYVEAWVDGKWLPLMPTLGLVGKLPRDLLVIGTGASELVEAAGVGALGSRYRVVREDLAPEELVVMMLPPNRFLTFISLYRLPMSTQNALRVILVMPVAALLIALFRNVVGLQTFGTFLPILVPLSMREAGLSVGLVMVTTVLLVGFLGRVFLDRFRLLFVPRLCILLCLVVLILMGVALTGYSLENRDMMTGVLFPIVILAMLIERFSISIAEEGARSAFTMLAATAIVVLVAYPLFKSSEVAHLMFGFPELVLCVMGMLVWIGGYTGYRVSELIRFRALATSSPGVGS